MWRNIIHLLKKKQEFVHEVGQLLRSTVGKCHMWNAKNEFLIIGCSSRTIILKEEQFSIRIRVPRNRGFSFNNKEVYSKIRVSHNRSATFNLVYWWRNSFFLNENPHCRAHWSVISKNYHRIVLLGHGRIYSGPTVFWQHISLFTFLINVTYKRKFIKRK